MQTVVFVFTPATGAVFTRSAQIGPDGVFSLSNLPANTYTVWIKSDKWLAKNAPNVGPNHPTLTVALPAGDTNNDNSCDSADFDNFTNAYDSSASVPGSGYDPTCDFNCDGVVDATDFGFFIGNYNTFGDAQPGAFPNSTARSSGTCPPRITARRSCRWTGQARAARSI